ncbi:MAG TPA: oligopeptide/dipeptide ABC transporter ATP-binding protein, partial [Methanomassiliicoccales archaeon]|nr:oligopeptide/dipeptide ABC transporter ATP-binding protein [Methanomassiliicoccales archaeon]
LVGESGCGKSVTANCVMRLIPTPPGKIEGGQILVRNPDGVIADLLVRHVVATFNKGSGLDIAKDKDAMVKLREACNQALIDLKHGQTVDIYLPSIIKTKSGSSDLKVSIGQDLYKQFTVQNILKMSNAQLRALRGKRISMIFQEPMAALNPVFTAGDQIAEIFLLHEMDDLIKSVISKLDAQIDNLQRTGSTVNREDLEDGEIKCPSCGLTTPSLKGKCKTCGTRFGPSRLKPLRLMRLRMQRKTYINMRKHPDDIQYQIMDWIPIVRSYRKPLKSEATGRAARMLRLVRIPDPSIVVRSYPHELSGGMQQRVMIAMALACRPQLLIADEPTTALDVTIQAQILKLMRELQEQTGTAILMITHNLGVVAEMCNRVGVMYAGNMVEVGSTLAIFDEPLHPYTQGLINSIPRLNVHMPRLEIIEGSVPNLLKPPSGCRFHPRCPYAMAICSDEKPTMKEVRPDHHVACHLFTEVSQ